MCVIVLRWVKTRHDANYTNSDALIFIFVFCVFNVMSSTTEEKMEVEECGSAFAVNDDEKRFLTDMRLEWHHSVLFSSRGLFTNAL